MRSRQFREQGSLLHTELGSNVTMTIICMYYCGVSSRARATCRQQYVQALSLDLMNYRRAFYVMYLRRVRSSSFMMSKCDTLNFDATYLDFNIAFTIMVQLIKVVHTPTGKHVQAYRIK